MNAETTYVAAILLTSGFVAVVAAWLWSDDHDLSGTLFVVTVALHPPVGLLVVGEVLAPTRSLSILFYAAHTALSTAIPLAFFLFALAFTSHRRSPSRRLSFGVVAYGALVAGLEATNPIHHLARGEYQVVGATVPHVVGTPTTPFMLVSLPIFVAYYAAMGILGYRYLVQRHGRWKQTTVLFVGFLAPFVVSGLWVVGAVPGPINGAFVVGSSWMAALAGWAVFRYRLFDVMPLAREAVFAALDERVVVVDRDRRLLDYNESAAETFPELADGRGRLVDGLLPELVDGEDDPSADGDGPSDPFVSAFTRHDEDPREYTVTTSPVRADGAVRGYAAVVRDVTDRQRQIRDLEQQKAQLERFASTLSHDIRNPLNVARGRTELAMADADPTHLEMVDDSLARIERIIDDLLTLSREGRTIDDRQRVALAEVATEAWRTTDTEDASFVIDPDAHVQVYADRTRLRNVFENLFRNAVEHGSTASRKADDSEEHGSTDSRMVSSNDTTVTLGRHRDGFYVEDDGPGIPDAERESVFEYEYTTGDGTGLGLAIVDAIARAHGWTVEAREGSDGGARIVFSAVQLLDDPSESDATENGESEAGAAAEAGT